MPDRLNISSGETLKVLQRIPTLLLLEASYAPGGTAPPAHYHPAQDEHFEVLDGALTIEVAGVQRQLHRGGTLDVPRGTSHRMWNPNSQPARARSETRPAGRTEGWFAALAALQGTEFVDSTGKPKALPFAALAHKYRDTFRLAASPAMITPVAVGVVACVARAAGQDPSRPKLDTQPERDLGALSGPLAGITFASGVAAGLAIADAPYPRPGAQPAAIRMYFGGNATAARASIAGQLVSATSLARFGATVAALARMSDPRSRRLPKAARASGAAAAGSLAASALTSLALTVHNPRSNDALLALHRRAFILGGPVHTASFGVLVGCLCLAGRRSGALPRALTNTGFASAAAASLSPLGLLVKPAVWLIPAGRFSGLLVAGIAGTRLGRKRDSR
jgi:cupin domain